MKLNARRRKSLLRANRPAHKGRKQEMANETQDSSMTLKVWLAWGFVGIPLAWGVIQTVANAMKLFQ